MVGLWLFWRESGGWVVVILEEVMDGDGGFVVGWGGFLSEFTDSFWVNFLFLEVEDDLKCFKYFDLKNNDIYTSHHLHNHPKTLSPPAQPTHPPQITQYKFNNLNLSYLLPR